MQWKPTFSSGLGYPALLQQPQHLCCCSNPLLLQSAAPTLLCAPPKAAAPPRGRWPPGSSRTWPPRPPPCRGSAAWGCPATPAGAVRRVHVVALASPGTLVVPTGRAAADDQLQQTTAHPNAQFLIAMDVDSPPKRTSRLDSSMMAALCRLAASCLVRKAPMPAPTTAAPILAACFTPSAAE